MAKAGKRFNGEADYETTRAKMSKLSRSTRQPAQIEDVLDLEEDLGHATSVKFLAAAKEPAKTSHAAVSNLKVMVEEGNAKLADLLNEKALGVTARDSEIKGILMKVILDAQRGETEMDKRGVKRSSTSTSAASAIYQSAKSKIASSRELLGHYERASQQLASEKGVPVMESGWEKSSETLQRILDSQRERYRLEVHQLLNEDPKPSKEQVKGDMSELDTELWDRFAVGEAKKENVEALDGGRVDTWAVVAKNAHQGVRRIVKAIPEDRG